MRFRPVTRTTRPATTPPMIGATMNTHSCASGVAPPYTAAAMDRAGFTEVLLRDRRGDAAGRDVDRALSLADAALGAEGLQVSDAAVRELGRRVADGRMTGDEAVAFIDALFLPSGVVGTQALSQVATLDERAGPFFDSASLLGLLRVSADALTALVQDRDVLAVVSADGIPLYPAFQFDATGKPLPRLREVLAQLDPALTDP